jgi:heat shock protein HslJ
MKKYLPLLLICILILSACQSPAAQLTGTWKLTALGPVESITTAVTDAEATLTFGDDGTVTGNSGCNSIGGEYKIEDKKITFDNLTSTLMACDDARMDQESTITQVLSGTADLEIEDQTLTITNNGVSLVFQRVAAK